MEPRKNNLSNCAIVGRLDRKRRRNKIRLQFGLERGNRRSSASPVFLFVILVEVFRLLGRKGIGPRMNADER
jgi:hypothetical protein